MILKTVTKYHLNHIAKGNTRLLLTLNGNRIRHFSFTSRVQQQESLDTEEPKQAKISSKPANLRIPLLNILQKELKDEIKTREFLTTPPSIATDCGFEILNNDIKQVIISLKKDSADESIYVFVDVDEYVNNNFEADSFSYEEAEINQEYQNENVSSTLEFAIVKKKDNSAMSFTVLINDAGLYGIEKINYFNDFSLLYSNEANDALKKNLSYGVNFKQLDPAVQEHMINYLDSKGLNEDLLTYIDEIASKEEQKRYENWLTNATKFLSS
ncbi:hypothetical protein ACO0OE_001147 [Hanseniaspora uvarum]